MNKVRKETKTLVSFSASENWFAAYLDDNEGWMLTRCLGFGASVINDSSLGIYPMIEGFASFESDGGISEADDASNFVMYIHKDDLHLHADKLTDDPIWKAMQPAYT